MGFEGYIRMTREILEGIKGEERRAGAAEEREACAVVCDIRAGLAADSDDERIRVASAALLEAGRSIRARGNMKQTTLDVVKAALRECKARERLQAACPGAECRIDAVRDFIQTDAHGNVPILIYFDVCYGGQNAVNQVGVNPKELFLARTPLMYIDLLVEKAIDQLKEFLKEKNDVSLGAEPDR